MVGQCRSRALTVSQLANCPARQNTVELSAIASLLTWWWMALLARETRMATVRADGDVQVLRISADRFQEFLVRRPRVALSMMKALVLRLREVESPSPQAPGVAPARAVAAGCGFEPRGPKDLLHRGRSHAHP